MKKLVVLLTAVAALVFSSTSNASITNAYWYSDGDGVINCSDWTWNSSPATLWMSGVHYDVPGRGEVPGQQGSPGHMVGTILTDSVDDPVLTLSGTVVNDTYAAWWGYQVKVIMSVPFSFVSPGPSVDNPPNYDWFISNQVNPAYHGGGPYAGKYVGSFDFSMGTPIGVGDTMQWLYSIDFSGGLMFTFSQEMTPWFVEIPEPTALGSAGMGALMLALRVRRGRRA